MVFQSSSRGKLSSSQVSVAAEAFVVAQFALSGFDVLEHAGGARFFFDLAVARSGGMMKISVHASLNGFWNLADRYLDAPQRASATAADYRRAINQWLERHISRVICCLVQFEPADLHRMPRLYLATPADVAAQLRERIDEKVDRIQGLPASWLFSQNRIAELMEARTEETQPVARLSAATVCAECARMHAAACAHSLPMMN